MRGRIKYANYEVLYRYADGKRTTGSYDFINEAHQQFGKNKAIKMVIYKATHNNTRIKLDSVHTKTVVN